MNLQRALDGWSTRPPHGKIYRFAGLALTIAAYGASFALPTYDAFSVTVRGYQAFALVVSLFESTSPGSLDDLMLLAAWSPNVLLWVGAGCFALGRFRAAFAMGALALALGNLWAVNLPDLRIELDDLRLGYYVWLSSMAILAMLGAVAAFHEDAGGEAPIARRSAA